MRTTLGLWIGMAVLGACSGNSSNGDDDGPPGGKLIPGGGVDGTAIAGDLFVHVVEDGTSTPIGGAVVSLGDGTVNATTDSSGFATFANVTGPQMITATANGHVHATWVGVAVNNATLPLQKSGTVPQAHVTGTIAGWEQLPAPSFGHYNLAVVLYSFLDDPTAPENAITQPMNGNTPLFTCIYSGSGSTACNWQINARVGKQIHTAIILDGDSNLTQDPADDSYTLIGYAAGDIVELTADQQMTNEVLQMTGTAQSLKVTFPAAASGLANVVAIPELSVPDVGRIVFPLPQLTPKSTTTQVMVPTGKFAGTYHLVGLATPNATAKTPFSTSFVANVAGTATLPAWIGAPKPQVTVPRKIMFTASAGAAFHTAQILATSGGPPKWNITVLDGSTTVDLPKLNPDIIGMGGPTTISVTAADVASFDPKHFDIPSTKSALARAAGGEVSAVLN
jgi:hypothetical protein